MPRLDNRQIAQVFAQMADLMLIRGDNAFRIRAFERAAETIENLPESADSMLAAGSLAKMPGIGSGTIARIDEILQTGTCADLRELHQTLPEGLLELLTISGVGPKTVKLVYDELGVSSVDELKAAAIGGHLARLPRMGEKSQEKLIKAITAHRRRRGRIPLAQALPQGEALVAELRHGAGIDRIELAGSTRRGRETIGDLDILVGTQQPRRVIEIFAAMPAVAEVLARGDTKCSVTLQSGLQTDLRVLPNESYGAALHYFTGSQLHNIAIRDRAKRSELRINEYGVFREPGGGRVGGADERDVFAAVGLPFIDPELRENRGEIEAAERGELPRLVTEADLRGDLHTHTSEADGRGSIREMALAATKLGLQYLAITDHSKAMVVARGLDERALRAQRRAIRELEQALGSIRLLAGVEVDILADGSLDLEYAALRDLDWVLASVHSRFEMDRHQMTTRIVRAMQSSVVDCIAHPTGRILGGHDPYLVDVDTILESARDTNVAVELSCVPSRLDLDANHCRHARELGVPVVINTDAHTSGQLSCRRYGILQARRAWLEPEDVLNCGPVSHISERRQARLKW